MNVFYHVLNISKNIIRVFDVFNVFHFFTVALCIYAGSRPEDQERDNKRRENTVCSVESIWLSGDVKTSSRLSARLWVSRFVCFIADIRLHTVLPPGEWLWVHETGHVQTNGFCGLLCSHSRGGALSNAAIRPSFRPSVPPGPVKRLAGPRPSLRRQQNKDDRG